MSEVLMLNTITGKQIKMKSVERYFHSLVNKFFKILPLYEDKEVTLCDYMRSLQNEILGLLGFLEDTLADDLIVSLLSILDYLIEIHTLNGFKVRKRIIKKEVFTAISICQKIEQKYSSLQESSYTDSNTEVC